MTQCQNHKQEHALMQLGIPKLAGITVRGVECPKKLILDGITLVEQARHNLGRGTHLVAKTKRVDSQPDQQLTTHISNHTLLQTNEQNHLVMNMLSEAKPPFGNDTQPEQIRPSGTMNGIPCRITRGAQATHFPQAGDIRRMTAGSMLVREDRNLAEVMEQECRPADRLALGHSFDSLEGYLRTRTPPVGTSPAIPQAIL